MIDFQLFPNEQLLVDYQDLNVIAARQLSYFLDQNIEEQVSLLHKTKTYMEDYWNTCSIWS